MKCQTPGCENESYGKRHYCHTCRKKQYATKHPLKYLFMVRRNNAKRRNKVWTLTFDEFKEFCERTGYDKNCGRYANDFSIDRINPDQGYTKENIRSITISDNVKLIRGTLDSEWLEESEDPPF